MELDAERQRELAGEDLQASFWRAETWHRLLWQGGSFYDAWCNTVTVQVGQVILTMPYSYAQVGFKFGLFFQLFYLTVGWWTCYLSASLYLEYRRRKEAEGFSFEKHMIQYNEVISGLVGPWSGRVTLFYEMMSMSSLSVAQIVACASNAYYINPNLNKRNWTLIFGGMALLAVLIPSMSEFRLWAFMGVLTTTYTAWYMFIASLAYGQDPTVVHSPPEDFKEFFTGATIMLFAFGGHAITVEVMHTMWKPRTYKYVYLLNCVYVLTITVPHSVSVYWAFGNKLLHKANALAIMPASPFRTLGLIFMNIHQAVAFGLFVMPLIFMWEKLLKIHQRKSYVTRVFARLPIPALLIFLALLVPFFGPLNSVIGSMFMCVPVFVIPPLAYTYTFRTKEARKVAADKPYKWLPWRAMVALNLAIALGVLVMGMGFGCWASISNIIRQVNTFGFFDKCYQCVSNSTEVSH